MKTIARIFCVLLIAVASFAQQGPTGPKQLSSAKEVDSATFTASGQTVRFQDLLGTVSNQFEIVVNNAPASLTLTISGCMRGGTCTPSPLASSSGTARQTLSVTGPYDYYNVTETWTGGSASTNIKVNRTGTWR